MAWNRARISGCKKYINLWEDFGLPYELNVARAAMWRLVAAAYPAIILFFLYNIMMMSTIARHVANQSPKRFPQLDYNSMFARPNHFTTKEISIQAA